MKINHIGYLVKKMDRAKDAFLKLGYILECDVIYDDYREVDICFLIKDGYRIELVSPKTKESVVYQMLKKYGNSPYHICYESDDFLNDISILEKNGYVKYDYPHEAIAFGGKKVCFMIHPYMGMIELLDIDNK